MTRLNTALAKLVLCALLLGACSSNGGAAPAMDAGVVDAPASVDLAADAATWAAGAIQVVQQPGSSWSVALEKGDVVARLEGSDLALLIDADGSTDDQRYAGVYVLQAGKARFAGTYNGAHCSMFVPDRPYKPQTDVRVAAAGSTLSVEMQEGDLSEVVDSKFPGKGPFRWQSSWSLGQDGLKVTASGLYYYLLDMQSCEVKVKGISGTALGTVQVQQGSAPMLRYFTDVKSIDVVSSTFGSFTIATDAKVLQVQVTSYPNTKMFELDFDHSFKDKGQLEVKSELVLPWSP